MTDYGHELIFGSFITPSAADPAQVIALAQHSERIGLDVVTFQDHPYQPAFLDTWTLMSYVAAATESISIAPNVINLPLRPPAVLARSAASLDLLTGGRFELGLGAGAFWDAIEAMGGQRRTPGEAVAGLTEAIALIRAVWAGDVRGGIRSDGPFYPTSGAKRGPAPAHPISIWLGAYGPRMLRLTGAQADGWLPSAGYLPPEKLAEAGAIIDEAAAAAGRDPSEIRRLYNITGAVADVGRLSELALEHGISAFILGSDDPDELARFASEVAPAVRERVAAARPSTGSGNVGGGSGNVGGSSGHEEQRSLSAGHEEQRSLSLSKGQGPSTSSGTVGGGSGNVRGSSGHEEQRSLSLSKGQGPSTGSGNVGGGSGSVGGGSGNVVELNPSFTLVPTPDDGTRLTTDGLIDEARRPRGPAPDPERTYTAHQLASGQHLIDIHDHLRRELEQIRDLVARVMAADLDVPSARAEIQQMALRQNRWTVGANCAAYNYLVTTHHTLEDRAVFPRLRAADPRLGPVLERLSEEHHVIHEVLDRIDAGLVAYVDSGDGAALRHATDLLSDTLLSHLSYEERELVEPLARTEILSG